MEERIASELSQELIKRPLSLIITICKDFAVFVLVAFVAVSASHIDAAQVWEAIFARPVPLAEVFQKCFEVQQIFWKNIQCRA
jgi:hypothetical protein